MASTTATDIQKHGDDGIQLRQLHEGFESDDKAAGDDMNTDFCDHQHMERLGKKQEFEVRTLHAHVDHRLSGTLLEDHTTWVVVTLTTST